MDQIVTSSYEHKLGHVYHKIDNRGILIDVNKLKKTEDVIESELIAICDYLSQNWNINVYVGKDDFKRVAGNTGYAKALNLNSPSTLLESLQDLGFKVPKIRKKDAETHEYEFVESVAELALRKLYGDPSLWPASTAGEGIKRVLDAREMITFRNRYVRAKLYKNRYYSNYNVAGTITGRRGSKKNIFGLGGNAQNFPSRGTYAEAWKECLIPKPGYIFFMVDQMQAEDWPVQALSQNYEALDDMRHGINRHYKFASAIFNKTIDDLKIGRKSQDALLRAQADMEYNLGKRGRHANNYGMQPTKMSEMLAAEGYSVPPSMCKMILETINRIDPNVKQVFHKYIQDCIFNSRVLRTPLGRERQFFGLRQHDKNYSILNEAYSWIPQSTVGDNTGIAILWLDGCNCYVIQESHDSVCQEVPDDEQELLRVYRDTRAAFKRTITFHNGIQEEIPIEGKIGLNWHDTITINDSVDDFTEEKVVIAYRKLKELRQQLEERNASTATGVVAGSLS